jgi:hypothetical protein
MKILNENSNVKVEGHVIIKDVDSGEVLLDKYNAINFQNFAYAVAKAMADQTNSSSEGYNISKLAFGYGGTTIDANGNVTYKDAKVDGGAVTGLYNASKDNSVSPVVDLQVAVTSFTCNNATNQPYTDLECKTVLDYAFPADATATDNASDFDTAGNFVFDEIGLMTEAGTYLTHLIFHPIQKSKNRKLEILYTLRIRAGV